MSFIMNINVDLIYPIGSIYMTTSTVSPAVLFGGTWKRIKGRCIVGVDENDTDFGTVSKTGGSKYLQAHTHNYLKWYNQAISYDRGTGAHFQGSLEVNNGSGNTSKNMGTGGVSSNITTGNSGNLQPYYTAYIWRRTA